MKQRRNDSCVAAVLGMIVMEGENYVIDWFGFDPPYSDEDAAIFLAHHGFFMGMYLRFEEGKKHRLEPNRENEVTFTIDEGPAYVVVKSERFPGKTHAIFWSGSKIYDPSPLADDGRPLSDYEIRRWYPLRFTIQRHRTVKRYRQEDAA